MPANATVQALQKAAADLTYPSETDAPLEPFAWPDAVGEPSANEVRKRSKQRTNAPIEERSLQEFFQPLVEEQDWFGDDEKALAAKFQALFDTVKQLLATPKVFRIGERKIAVYVIGQAKEGGWAGLKTVAVET